MKLCPFFNISPKAPEGAKCHLLSRVGICWGQQGSPEPNGLLALWVFHGRYLARRTENPDGSLREHYRFSYLSLEFEAAGRCCRLRIGRPWRWPIVAYVIPDR